MNTNNNYYTPVEMEIDLIELLWRMISQWKAILVCALTMALLVPSAVYLKDTRAYEAAQAEAEKAADELIDPTEAIEKLLVALKPEDRPAVRQAIHNDEIIEEKMEYLNSSLLINLDADKAATAMVGYLIDGEAAEDSDRRYAFFKGYSAAFGDSKALSEIMGAMGIKSEPKYIKELIWDDGTLESETSYVFKINIVCPDAAMVENVVKASDNIMERSCESLSKTVGKHSVKRIFTQSSPKTLESVSTTAGNAYGALYNLQSQQRAHIGTFNEDQKAAYEAIAEIRANVLNVGESMGNEISGDVNKSNDNSGENKNGELVKPGFSIKFAVIGFILGTFVYVMLYIVWLVLSRRIDNAGAAQSYTSARLLGEYYYPAKNGGLSALLHSRAVTKRRYTNKMDFSAQADRISEAIFASCTNKGIEEIALLQLFEDKSSENGASADALVTEVSKNVKEAGIGLIVDTILAFPAPDEKDLSDKKNAVFFVTDNTKTTVLDNTLSLCKDYGIGKIGTVFIGEV